MNFCLGSLELTMRIIIYDINKKQMSKCLVLFGSFFITKTQYIDTQVFAFVLLSCTEQIQGQS